MGTVLADGILVAVLVVAVVMIARDGWFRHVDEDALWQAELEREERERKRRRRKRAAARARSRRDVA